MAKSHYTTKPLSQLFTSPVLRAAFEAAERDGLAPAAVIVDRPGDLDGGAVVRPEFEPA